MTRTIEVLAEDHVNLLLDLAKLRLVLDKHIVVAKNTSQVVHLALHLAHKWVLYALSLVDQVAHVLDLLLHLSELLSSHLIRHGFHIKDTLEELQALLDLLLFLLWEHHRHLDPLGSVCTCCVHCTRLHHLLESVTLHGGTHCLLLLVAWLLLHPWCNCTPVPGSLRHHWLCLLLWHSWYNSAPV